MSTRPSLCSPHIRSGRCRNCKCQATLFHLGTTQKNHSDFIASMVLDEACCDYIMTQSCICQILLLFLPPWVGVNLMTFPRNHPVWESPSPSLLIYLQYSLHTVCNSDLFEEVLQDISSGNVDEICLFFVCLWDIPDKNPKWAIMVYAPKLWILAWMNLIKF